MGSPRHVNAAKKSAAKKSAPIEQLEIPTYNGIPQFGDARIWNESNAHLAQRMSHVSPSMVKPNDFVYHKDPTKRFTFFLFDDSRTHDAAARLDRLRTRGWFKVTEEDFVSHTGRFQAVGQEFKLGNKVWFAVPMERVKVERQKRDATYLTIADVHTGLEDDINEEYGDEGASAFAEVTSMQRGERKPREA